MPFSHHSHSGQFCPGHAVNTLEEVVQTAITKGLRVFALTEHMPRHEIDFYPEEKDGNYSLEKHYANESAYYAEASRLRDKYKGRIELPIGFESDWIRPESRDLIERSISGHSFDFFVGSVHHVHTIPIDYDQGMYDQAREKAGGSDELLFQDYFDAQLDMMRAVKPPVIGHFDLIRLKSEDPNSTFTKMSGVWGRIERNLDFIAAYGGVLEVNTAALRKGMREPYPGRAICQLALSKGIRFCLSDDSHGIDHVAYGFVEAIEFVKSCGITHLCYVKHVDSPAKTVDHRFANMEFGIAALSDLRDS
ncbi:putative histidinol-phosphatase [Cyphellophora attinorum]|uniref:Histidinol-phosphatase n=1 Tax=Cyphellophora attinorum TaxID=1664694 RepID=A0A0N1HE96_9EURO|nr:putative histidinol-phosphatase [Phialophora attinorum]KPI43062.1 putative histidinol-phosphatase [Phialophora attinorum]